MLVSVAMLAASLLNCHVAQGHLPSRGPPPRRQGLSAGMQLDPPEPTFLGQVQARLRRVVPEVSACTNRRRCSCRPRAMPASCGAREVAHTQPMPVRTPPDNAGVVAPAPVIYAVAIAAGLVAERVAPSSPLPSPVGAWLASTLIAISIALVASAFRALTQAHTAFDARKPTTAIVTTGAFRFSRNPTYLSLTLLHIGIAFAIGSWWVFFMVAPAVAVTQWGVILREERYLNAKFGEEYRNYASKVRRWL